EAGRSVTGRFTRIILGIVLSSEYRASVFELGVPVGAAAAGRHVENVPERGGIGREVWIEARIGGLEAAFGRPEQPRPVAIALPHEHRGAFVNAVLAVGQSAVVAPEIVADGLIELQVAPAALAGDGELALDRRA